MNRIIIPLLFSTLLFCSSTYCFAQVNFYAEASPLEVAKNEYITYKLTIENGEGEAGIKPPSFAGFKVMGAPAQSTSKNIIKNSGARKIVQSISLTYVLQAKAAGTYSIGTSTANIADKTYQSNAVQIIVTDATGNNNNNQNGFPTDPFADISFFDGAKRQEQFKDHILKKGDDNVQDKIAKNMHFNLELNKTSCYIGEPITATYKLYSRLDTESKLEKFPSFTSASVVDMTPEYGGQSYTQEKLAGRNYNLYTICKAQLYPLQSGVLTIDASTLNNKVSFAKYDASNNGTLFIQDINLYSKPQQLNILPLPEKNKPENFAGSVGNFTINAQVENNNFFTSDIGKLVVTINGSGNMQLLTSPTIHWPAGFEVFEMKSTDNTVASTIPISGNKVFEIPFAIDKAGSYTLPKIAFSFFNGVTKNYEIIYTNEIQLNITKGNGNLQRPNNISAAKIKNTFSLGRLIGSIILLVLLSLSYFIFFVKKKNKAKAKVLPQEIVEDEKPVFIASEKNYLAKTKLHLDNNETNIFYNALQEEFSYFLTMRYGSAIENMQIATIENTLDGFGVNNNLSNATKKLLQKIELELYTPFEKDNNLQTVYNNAQSLIQEHILQKKISR
jgi:hypothetical protein